MTISYNLTGEDRKRLVQALGEVLQEKPIYMRAPTYGYTVGVCTVDKNGMISWSENNPTLTGQILSGLSERGFTPYAVDDAPAPEENAPTMGAETADIAPEAEPGNQPAGEAETPTVGAESPEAAEEPAPQPVEAEEPGNTPVIEAPTEEDESPAASTETDDTHLTISIPRSFLTDSALERLRQIVANKEVLFKRALSAEALPIEATEEKISFPWFPVKGVTGEAAAYGQFITALCQMAKEQTRILDKPYDGDNDRFAMRIFMVRMGMKGAQFALARKLMMQDLTGNSGWRFGAPPKKQPEQEKPASEEVASADEQTAPATQIPDTSDDKTVPAPVKEAAEISDENAAVDETVDAPDEEVTTVPDEEPAEAVSEAPVDSDTDTPDETPVQED